MNNTQILRRILNKSRKQHPTKHQLYSNLPSISLTIRDEEDVLDAAREVFITLTKHNTHQQREDGKPLLVMYCLISILLSSNVLLNQYITKHFAYM